MDSKLLKKLKNPDKKTCYSKLHRVINSNKETDIIVPILKNPDEFIKKLKVFNALNENYEETDTNIDKIILFIVSLMRANKLTQLPFSRNFTAKIDEYYLSFLNFSKLSDISKQTYFKKYEKVKKDIYNDDTLSLIEILFSPKEFEQKINEYAKNTKGRTGSTLGNHWIQNTFAPFVALFKHNQQFERRNQVISNIWYQMYNEISNKIETKYDSNKPTDRQDLKIDLNKAKQVLETLKNGSDEKLLLSLLTTMPPLRSDYGNIVIVKTKKIPLILKDSNYYDSHNKEIVLNKYKTAHKYGTLNVKISDEAHKQLLISLKIKPRNYLFTNKRNQPFIEQYPVYYEKEFNAFANNILRKIFKNEKISLTYFRHIYISGSEEILKNLANSEKRKIAVLMGHSLMQQSKYKWI
jgi:hypothetical protein